MMKEEIVNQVAENEEVEYQETSVQDVVQEEMTQEDITHEAQYEEVSSERVTGEPVRFKWNAYFTATLIFTLAALFMASRGDYVFALMELVAIILCFKSGMKQMRNGQ